jgi:hypothetical protein
MAILCEPLGEIQRRRNGHGESFDDGTCIAETIRLDDVRRISKDVCT